MVEYDVGRAGHRKFKLNSATANPQVCDRFAVTFRTSATANEHCTSAIFTVILSSRDDLFVLEVKFCRRPDVDFQKKKRSSTPRR